MADLSVSPLPVLPSASHSPTGKSIGIIQALTEEFDSLPRDIIEDIRTFCDEIVRAGFAHA